ncbi:hypothetical protein [Deinococcus hohokamensis]|uniref:Uncharacterized protein n=1 Tax=Deinococcus hohokamensis TaxID=309883 RepID=A0ABV9IEL6_9DEIO
MLCTDKPSLEPGGGQGPEEIDDVLLAAVIERLRIWLALQRSLLNTVDEFLAPRQRVVVNILGERLLDQQWGVQQHCEVLWHELTFFRSPERMEDVS